MPPPNKKRRRLPAWKAFQEEIVTQIYGPRIVNILTDNPDVLNIRVLAHLFAEEHNCAVSPKMMTEWLNICELTPVPHTDWEGLEGYGTGIPLPNED